jgi:hypothetical protein
MTRFHHYSISTILLVLATFVGITAHAADDPDPEKGKTTAGPALILPTDSPSPTADEPHAPAKSAEKSKEMPSVEGAVEKHPASAVKNSTEPAT